MLSVSPTVLLSPCTKQQQQQPASHDKEQPHQRLCQGKEAFSGRVPINDHAYCRRIILQLKLHFKGCQRERRRMICSTSSLVQGWPNLDTFAAWTDRVPKSITCRPRILTILAVFFYILLKSHSHATATSQQSQREPATSNRSHRILALFLLELPSQELRQTTVSPNQRLLLLPSRNCHRP